MCPTTQRVFIAMIVGGGIFLCVSKGYAASENTDAQDDLTAARTVLDNSLWVSTRADGMAGAIGALADGSDAPYYNPAGIGGMHLVGPQPAIRHLNFPFLGASVNKNAVNMRRDMSGDGISDPSLTAAILNAHQDKRQYGRFSFVPSLGISRLYLAYVMDTQFAALSLGNDTNLIRTHYRNQSGPLVGFSACDANQKLCLGASGAYLSRTEIKNDFSFEEINDPALRKEALKRDRDRYRGASGNLGVTWQMSKVARPKFSVVAHDVGDTKFKTSSSEGTNVIQKESLSAAFGLSPQLGRSAWFDFCLQGDDLTESDTSMEKKMRVAMELSIGEQYGHRSIMGFRAGYASAGSSYGMHLNMGMLEFSASSYAVDIGTANNSLIERRFSAIFAANIGEY
jgi:hypothetical protein